LKIKTEEVVDAKTGEASLRFVKCKARVVYGGHMSRYGEDYDQTAAFVCSPKTIRSMLALAAPRGYKVVSFDVSQAFVHSRYEEEDRVYMELPPLVRLDGSRVGSDGDEVEYEGCGGGKNRKTVAKLSRYLYGSKDAPRRWAQAVQAFCEKIGAESLISDRMAFRWRWKGHTMNFAVHVVGRDQGRVHEVDEGGVRGGPGDWRGGDGGGAGDGDHARLGAEDDHHLAGRVRAEISEEFRL